MEEPRIYLYPHGKEEFEFIDELEAYILCHLRESGEYYHTDIRDLPPGSVILFLYRERIIGEGVIKSVERPPFKEGYEKYRIKINFEPKLVRLYPRYLLLNELEDLEEFKKYKEFKEKKGPYPFQFAINISEKTYFTMLQRLVAHK